MQFKRKLIAYTFLKRLFTLNDSTVYNRGNNSEYKYIYICTKIILLPQ